MTPLLRQHPTRLSLIRLWLGLAACGLMLAGTPGTGHAQGLFVSAANLAAIRARVDRGEQPWASEYAGLISRAESRLAASADPFAMADVRQIVSHWCSADNDGIDNSLRDAVDDFDEDAGTMRDLALAFALSGDERFAAKALALMREWAQHHTPVNLHDLGVNYAAATLDGMTSGYCSDRPWNFALDAMFQAYGLIGISDAYLLLSSGGHPISSADDALIRAWILRVVEAVNSSHLAWTKWADAHTNSSSYERYRSDNHLSWTQAGLLAGGIALGDDALVGYVLDGDSWTDSRSGSYANPSPISDVIDRAIESGTGAANEGRVYEEQILRDPPIGYAFYHLWALTSIALMAEVQLDRDVWTWTGSDGAGLEDAYTRYADFLLGNRASPRPSQEGDLTAHAWMYEAAYRRWARPLFQQARDASGPAYLRQTLGPPTLLLRGTQFAPHQVPSAPILLPD